MHISLSTWNKDVHKYIIITSRFEEPFQLEMCIWNDSKLFVVLRKLSLKLGHTVGRSVGTIFGNIYFLEYY